VLRARRGKACPSVPTADLRSVLSAPRGLTASAVREVSLSGPTVCRTSRCSGRSDLMPQRDKPASFDAGLSEARGEARNRSAQLGAQAAGLLMQLALFLTEPVIFGIRK
jgi:hypothetical protein